MAPPLPATSAEVWVRALTYADVSREFLGRVQVVRTTFLQSSCLCLNIS